ncbi:hypothetical protein [Polaribacter sp.]|uniref:hypothetical protein n=1 Tax=Polaribacter sp. TaxID=1920175 RepID=UPI003EF1D3B3
MGYWNRLIGKEPIESQIIGIYSKRKEQSIEFYERSIKTEKDREKYKSKRLINSKIVALKYSTSNYKIKISSEIRYANSFFGNFAIDNPRDYLFDVVAPLEAVGDLVKFQLSDIKNNEHGIILLANSNIAILSLSKNDSVEYFK